MTTLQQDVTRLTSQGYKMHQAVWLAELWHPKTSPPPAPEPTREPAGGANGSKPASLPKRTPYAEDPAPAIRTWAKAVGRKLPPRLSAAVAEEFAEAVKAWAKEKLTSPYDGKRKISRKAVAGLIGSLEQ